MTRAFVLSTAFLLVPLSLAIPDIPLSNDPVVIQLRVEGDKGTIFDGPILTQGHIVDTKLGGKHPCDGTNKTNPNPFPTATSALDDASKAYDFIWDGPFFSNVDFSDYLVKDISGVKQNVDSFWNLYLNYTSASVGGCQLQVAPPDEVLWAFATSYAPPLKLSGPTLTRLRMPTNYTVTDGRNGFPIGNVSVNGEMTDENGVATLTFRDVGTNKVKADKPCTIRSKTLSVNVIL